MKLTFISNYINHHQLPFCEACYRELGESFIFIQVMPMAQDRQALGWDKDAADRPYVRLLYREEALCRQILAESDVVLLGWMGDEYDHLAEEILRPSLERGRPVFRSSERIYKTGQWKMISPRGLIAKRRQHLIYRDAPVYLLCSGAYVSSDYQLIGAYPDKMYRWGYFPPFVKHTDEELESIATLQDPVRLVWAGRFIPWKHPEFALRLAEKLRRLGIPFELTMVGDGRLRNGIQAQALEKGLSEQIIFTGALPPEDVRRVMEEGDIFLFTSNYLEGWGAVVNEAMNSALAIVASDEAGAVPWLIESGVNGVTYSGGSYEAFEQAVMSILAGGVSGRDALRADAPDKEAVKLTRRRLGIAACHTIGDRWNADEASARFLEACREAVAGRTPVPASDGGPMSTANILHPPGFLRSLKENRLAEGL